MGHPKFSRDGLLVEQFSGSLLDEVQESLKHVYIVQLYEVRYVPEEELASSRGELGLQGRLA